MMVRKITFIISVMLIAMVSLQTRAVESNVMTTVDDTMITAWVKAKMLADKTVPSLEISVETKEGVVTLSGKVKTEAEATAAVELAAATEGVKKVDASGLKMADGRAGHQALADAIITGEVKGALIREKLSGDESDTGSRVKVETKEGVVYLSGTLKSAEKEKHAIKLARAIQGVKAVEATITIKSGE